jgi:hypothetical protein
VTAAGNESLVSSRLGLAALTSVLLGPILTIFDPVENFGLKLDQNMLEYAVSRQA